MFQDVVETFRILALHYNLEYFHLNFELLNVHI